MDGTVARAALNTIYAILYLVVYTIYCIRMLSCNSPFSQLHSIHIPADVPQSNDSL